MASHAQLNVWLEQVTLLFARLGLRKRSGADYARELAPGVPVSSEPTMSNLLSALLPAGTSET